MGTAIKHPVPDRVKPSFVIFDILALRRSDSCTHMATVGFKGLKMAEMIVDTIYPSFIHCCWNHQTSSDVCPTLATHCVWSRFRFAKT